MSRTYTVIFEREADGRFSATVPSLRGCASWGTTLDEARVHVREAIEVYLEGLQAIGQPVPEPDSHIEAVESVEVSIAA